MEAGFPKNVHCIGIKGSGVSALAVLLTAAGCRVSGSDVKDIFYTDAVLRSAGISWNTSFDASNIPDDAQLIIYSPAYTAENNAELHFAMQKNNTVCISYPKALGMLSKSCPATAVIGTHGKTTASAFIGLLCKSQNLPVSVLSGSALRDFGNSPVWYNGTRALFAEVCEYKNHFADFSPAAALITSAELDHPDFFSSAEDVYKTFAVFLEKLPHAAALVACADDSGVLEVLNMLSSFLVSRSIRVFLYSRKKNIRINTPKKSQYIHIQEHGIVTREGIRSLSFSVHGLNEEISALTWFIPVPVPVLIDNAVGALICVTQYMKDSGADMNILSMHRALSSFGGITRRSEVLFQNGQYTIIDDYAHHPTAIEKTLAGIRAFFAPARCVVNFMPHTYSRTRALWDDFASCFSCADEVIINDVYASAREKSEEEYFSTHEENCTENDAEQLADAIANRGKRTGFPSRVLYIPSTEQTAAFMQKEIRPGDLFITLGAGDNFKVSQTIARFLRRREIA